MEKSTQILSRFIDEKKIFAIEYNGSLLAHYEMKNIMKRSFMNSII